MIHIQHSPARALVILHCINIIHSLNTHQNSISRIGVLTSGGDCPGLNACIRAIVKSAKSRKVEVWGFPRGLPGLLETSPVAFPLDEESFSCTDMLRKGGSRLGGFVSSDFKMFDTLTLEERAAKYQLLLRLWVLMASLQQGGDSSLDRIGNLLQHTGDDNNIPFVGIPKSIDNDIPETLYSLGFQTAVSTAAKAIASVRDTAESHRRVIVVECMGREAGFLTLHAGLAGGADTILLPEFSIDSKALVNHVKSVYAKHQHAIVAVSESISLPQTKKTATYTTADGRSRLGGSGEAIARYLSESLAVDARHVVLGHVQRGGSPNAFDQVMGTTLGAKAVSVMCDDGLSEVFVTQRGMSLLVLPLDKVRDVPSQCLRCDSPEVQAALSLGIYCGSVI